MRRRVYVHYSIVTIVLNTTIGPGGTMRQVSVMSRAAFTDREEHITSIPYQVLFPRVQGDGGPLLSSPSVLAFWLGPSSPSSTEGYWLDPEWGGGTTVCWRISVG